MAAQDLELSSGVRSVLARHWIDLTKTTYFVRRGHVTLGGEVSLLGGGHGAGNTADMLKAFEVELHRLREVKTVTFEFSNWIRDGAGVWICLYRKPNEPAPDPSAAPAGSS
jgi:hypothetical protein